MNIEKTKTLRVQARTLRDAIRVARQMNDIAIVHVYEGGGFEILCANSWLKDYGATVVCSVKIGWEEFENLWKLRMNDERVWGTEVVAAVNIELLERFLDSVEKYCYVNVWFEGDRLVADASEAVLHLRVYDLDEVDIKAPRVMKFETTAGARMSTKTFRELVSSVKDAGFDAIMTVRRDSGVAALEVVAGALDNDAVQSVDDLAGMHPVFRLTAADIVLRNEITASMYSTGLLSLTKGMPRDGKVSMTFGNDTPLKIDVCDHRCMNVTYWIAPKVWTLLEKYRERFVGNASNCTAEVAQNV